MIKTHLNCHSKIINFLKPNKKNKYKTIDIIDHFLHLELSDDFIFNYEVRNEKFRKVYASRNNNYNCYSKHKVFIYFPLNNVRFDMPIHKATTFPIAQNILEGNFKEKPIKILYYDKKSKQVIEGPHIVIISAPMESIVFENGRNLKNQMEMF